MMVTDKGVTEDEIEIILQKHNDLRKLISDGEVPGQPKGTNLKILKWDKQLAEEAQKIAETRKFRHVTVSDDRWPVGQNLRTTRSTKLHKGANWNKTIQKWFNENEKYKYGNDSIEGTGHYTQVIWADTEFVGCGYTSFKIHKNSSFKYQHLYVCNYGPSGNIKGSPPYSTEEKDPHDKNILNAVIGLLLN